MVKNKGFTTAELLVILAIMVIIISAISSSFLLSQWTYRSGENTSEVIQNGRVILERMTREMRQAKEVVTVLYEDESGATSTILFEDGHTSTSYNYIHYFTQDSTVEREVLGYYFSGDTQQALVPHDAIPPEGQTLQIKNIEETVAIGEYVTSLKIWGNSKINIKIQLTKKNKSIELQSEIFVRNI